MVSQPLSSALSLPTGLLTPGESRARGVLPVRSFPQCKVYIASKHEEGCYVAEDRRDKGPLQTPSQGSGMLPVPVQASRELQFCC